ncbi:MAG: hypothetical protein RID42_00335 [Alphaproteobacteria bacterium]
MSKQKQPLNDVERRMADFMLEQGMEAKAAYLAAHGLPMGRLDAATSRKIAPVRQRIAAYLAERGHPGELANVARREEKKAARLAAKAAAEAAAAIPDAVAESLIRRYAGPLDRATADAMAEDIRLASMEKGAMGVAMHAFEVRAALNGIGTKPSKETPTNSTETPNDSEGMDHAEFQRRIGPLLDEYRQITGVDLFPSRASGGDGADDPEPAL